MTDSSVNRRRMGDILPILALMALFFVAILFVGPDGNFPLNDDWSYATTIRSFTASGEWKPIGFTSMPLITNALWAWPACKVGSCGFEALRAMTLVASLILLLLTYLVLNTIASRAVAFASALVVAFNPIGLTLSFTSMTDVLFWLCFFASSVAFWMYTQRRGLVWVIIGTGAALAATMSRQLGLAPAVAFALTSLLLDGGVRNRLTIGILPVAICAIAFVTFNHWLSGAGRLPALYVAQSSDLVASLRSPGLLIKRLAQNTSMALMEVALFLCPVLLLTHRPDVRAQRARLAYLPMGVAGLAVILVAADMSALHRIMPLGKDILVREGVGPLTLKDTFILGLPDVPPLSLAWWVCVTLVGVGAVYELVYRTTVIVINAVSAQVQRHDRSVHNGSIFLLLVVCVYSIPPLLVSAYDRYFIALIPTMAMIIGSWSPRRRVAVMPRSLACIAAAILVVFSIASVHDYMSWNRARWLALDDLVVNKQVSWQEIDGGFEFNGFYGYDPFYKPDTSKSSWWVKGDKYIVAFKPFGIGNVVQTVPYNTLLPPFKRSLVVVEK